MFIILKYLFFRGIFVNFLKILQNIVMEIYQIYNRLEVSNGKVEDIVVY